MDVLIRRESFGYLAMDRKSESLFVMQGTDNVDLSDPSALRMPAGRGTYASPNSIEVRPSVVRRDDILVAPTLVEFYPTRVCNERCPNFCYFGDILNTKAPSFPSECLVPFLDNLRRAGVFQLVVLGGEPFLYRHLPLLLEEAASREFVVSLSTNGTHWRPEVVERVIDLEVHLNVSLHSHEQDVHDRIVGREGAFVRTVRTIHALVQRGTAPHISVVLTHDNHARITDTIRFLHDIGINSASVLHTQNTGFARHTHKRLLDFERYVEAAASATEQADRFNMALQATTNYPFLVVKGMRYTLGSGLDDLLYGHPDGRRVVYVLDDGSILGTLYQDLRRPKALGNCVTDDLAALWANSDDLDLLRRRKPPAACLSCTHFSYCRGGPLQDRSGDVVVQSTLPRCPLFDTHLAAE